MIDSRLTVFRGAPPLFFAWFGICLTPVSTVFTTITSSPFFNFSPLSSSQGEFHPKALTEPCLTVSRYTALPVKPPLYGFLNCQWTNRPGCVLYTFLSHLNARLIVNPLLTFTHFANRSLTNSHKPSVDHLLNSQ